MKKYVRKNTNQTFAKMIQLIDEAKEEFERKGLYMHLIRRFWWTIHAYNNGATYEEVLRTYFSGKSKAKTQEHLRISNNNLTM